MKSSRQLQAATCILKSSLAALQVWSKSFFLLIIVAAFLLIVLSEKVDSAQRTGLAHLSYCLSQKQVIFSKAGQKI